MLLTKWKKLSDVLHFKGFCDQKWDWFEGSKKDICFVHFLWDMCLWSRWKFHDSFWSVCVVKWARKRGREKKAIGWLPLNNRGIRQDSLRLLNRAPWCRYYNSLFDTAREWNNSYPDNITKDDAYHYVTPMAKNLQKVATVVARSVYRYVTGRHSDLLADMNTVSSLFRCEELVKPFFCVTQNV